MNRRTLLVLILSAIGCVAIIAVAFPLYLVYRKSPCDEGALRDGLTATRTGKNAESFWILQINDVYKIEGINSGTLGGLARLRSLRQTLEREAPVLVLHAGDMGHPKKSAT